MRVTVNLTLEEYIRKGNNNVEGLLAGHHPLMGLITAYYEFFATKLWSERQPVPEVPMFLATNAFMLWTSGVRIAMSGHEAAVYPISRTALESPSYSLVISTRPDLAPVWSDRQKGMKERKAARKAFRTAVSDAAFDLSSREPQLGAFINELYEASIDSGAHPNPLGIMRHVQVSPLTADETGFGQGSIYPGDSMEVFRALLAAVEFAKGIAMVLLHCLPVISTQVAEALIDLQRRQQVILRTHEAQ